MDEIKTFTGKHEFLSNFHREKDGSTAEHKFQAAKTDDPTEKAWVLAAPTPAAAKARGKKVQLQEGWNTDRIQVMLSVLRVKFQDPDLRAKLQATGNADLQEGNFWGDTFWGVSTKTGKGQNNLGRLLMQVREENRGV